MGILPFLNFTTMGTRNNAGECAAISEAHLPFAGITLFRFNGCDLSLSGLLEKHPGIYMFVN